MATDAAILTAARNLSTAIAAVNDADDVVKRLSEEHRRACTIAEEKRKHARECEQRLVQLSAQKPSEPPPKPVIDGATGKPHPTKVGVLTEVPNDVFLPGEGKLPSPEQKPGEKELVVAQSAMPSPVQNLSRKR